jgi:hypothetical protein
MKRTTLWLAAVAAGFLAPTLGSAAEEVQPQFPQQPPQEQHQAQYPCDRPQPGFGKSRYGVKIIYQGPGYRKVRYTYPGYEAGFPPPAMYYYGYPLSGFSYGAGAGVP